VKSAKDISKQLGKRIVQLRRERMLSQADLSYEADIDLSALSRLERGLANPTLEILYRLSTALKLKVKDLFDF
jgi:transcriptional regulator with XRE-family HTH domain